MEQTRMIPCDPGSTSRLTSFCALALLLLAAGASLAAQELPEDMSAGWRTYIEENDRMFATGDASSDAFLYQDISGAEVEARAREAVRRGEIFTSRLIVVREGRFPFEVPGALVHHWGGSVFVPQTTLDDVLELAQDYDNYPYYFDDVDAARVLERDGGAFRVFVKLHRTQVITVNYNTEIDVQFERHGPRRASQRSIMTKIAELDNAGQPNEREKAFGEDRGFLWRLNSNWRYEERDEGVVIEVETISLSRRVPRGLGWLVGGFVESIPQESLEGTLAALRDALGER